MAFSPGSTLGWSNSDPGRHSARSRDPSGVVQKSYAVGTAADGGRRRSRAGRGHRRPARALGLSRYAARGGSRHAPRRDCHRQQQQRDRREPGEAAAPANARTEPRHVLVHGMAPVSTVDAGDFSGLDHSRLHTLGRHNAAGNALRRGGTRVDAATEPSRVLLLRHPGSRSVGAQPERPGGLLRSQAVPAPGNIPAYLRRVVALHLVRVATSAP